MRKLTKVPTKTSRLREARRERARSEVLEAAREVLLTEGIAAFSIPAVARRLGVTKPAVYHYVASREALVNELVVRVMGREATAVVEALATASTLEETVAAALWGCTSHHLANLDDFRLCYALGQLAGPSHRADGVERPKSVYPNTTMIYEALEKRFAAHMSAKDVKGGRPRRLAVALHMCALGITTMYGVTNGRGDPLKHDYEVVSRELAALVARGLVAESSRAK